MIITLVVLGVGVSMLVIEFLTPGRSWPAVTGWWSGAIALNGVQARTVFVAGATWDRWLTDV